MKSDIKNALKLAFIFLGIFIGAAFTSGQEVLQFYNNKSANLTTMIFATFFLMFNCYVVFKKISDSKITTFNDYVIKCSSKPIGSVFNTLTIITALICFVGMFSAAGAIFSEFFHLKPNIGVGLIAISCFLVFVFEARGILTVNSYLGPIKIIGIFILAIITIKNSNLAPLKEPDNIKNLIFPLSPMHFIITALATASHVSFNCAECGAIFVPFHKIINAKVAKLGAIFSGLFAGTLLFLIWFAQQLSYNEIKNLELPMYYLIQKTHPFFQCLYLFLVCSGTFTTAVSMGFALLSQINKKTLSNRIINSTLLVLIGCVLSVISFATLVGNVFSFMGYIEIIWTIIIFVDFFKGRRKIKKIA